MHPHRHLSTRLSSQQFQYPLFRIVECISAEFPHPANYHRCFNIRSFGSWNASAHWQTTDEYRVSFNIRSFGSWNASAPEKKQEPAPPKFQYPLFRIVECIIFERCHQECTIAVSISALSDRGMHLAVALGVSQEELCFNIRSFGSWNASGVALSASAAMF